MCLMERSGRKNVPHVQITNHICRAKEMRCQLELINQATIKMGSFRTTTINILRHGKISYFSDAKVSF